MKPTYKGKAIVFTGKEKAAIKNDMPFPKVDDEAVVIKTEYSGISRGTECDNYTGQFHEDGHNYPIVTGYEPVGKVVYAGKRVRHIALGDRALGSNLATGYPKPYFCAWGGSVEYAVYSKETAPVEWYTQKYCAGRRVNRIPDDISDKDSLFGSLGAVALHGIDRVGISKGEDVLVIGLGVVGNIASQLAQLLEANVMAVDLYKFRCDIARKCGITNALNVSKKNVVEIVRDYRGGKDPDVIIECSGDVDNIDTCFELIGGHGRIHFQGAYLQPYSLTIQHSPIFLKSIAVSGSCGSTPYHTDRIFNMISKKILKVCPMFTRTYPLDKVQQAYQTALHAPDKTMKMAITW